MATEAQLAELDRAITEEMDAALDFAIASEPPVPEDMYRDVYAPGEPVPVRERLARILATAR